MFFNSIDFAIFLPIVFVLYWFVFNTNLKLQNILILLASYFFYGCWDYRFLALIIFSSAVDFTVGILLEKQERPRYRKFYLCLSIFTNLGFLGIFKYYNFFAESLAESFTLLGYGFEASRLNVILPVGISFYTFQTLSYTIDVYRKRLEPTRDPVAFFAFVSFFPQLVAGPIERATNLLPQFTKSRVFDTEKASDGIRQILWGLFKKVVIADNCAIFVDDIFLNSESYSGSTLLLGAIFFSFQIYCDFSGYSDIAIGTARLFGINLMRNFAFPYFSRDIAEFWRRWHISLSTWFRDYVYIPLGGSRGGTWMKIRNTLVIFLLSGLWHGANWTFIVWGLINALCFLPLMLLDKNRVNSDTVAQGKLLPDLREFVQMSMTFAIATFAWIFFRAEDLTHAFSYINGIFSLSLFSKPELVSLMMIKLMLSITVLMVFEWVQRDKQHALQIHHIHFLQRRAGYAFVFSAIFFFGEFSLNEFIYFQF